MKKVTVELDDDSYQTLLNRAKGQRQSLSTYLGNKLTSDASYTLNYEQGHYIGAIITGWSITHNNDTVVLGGSNYTYVIDNARSVDENAEYRVMDYVGGQLILRKIE